MDHVEDQEVVAAVLAGDVDAFGILVARYQRPVFNLMFRMTGSQEDAVDLAQETFIKAYEQLHRFRQDKKFYTWLYTMGLNHCRNFLRRSKLSRNLFVENNEAEPKVDQLGHNEDSLCARLDAGRLHDALQKLPVDYREAVILRYHEEFSMDDIAQALDISLSGAKMRVHRGLKKLRDVLEKDRHEDEVHASKTGSFQKDQ